MIEALMYSMLLWMGANCAAIDGIHPKHNPCQYNYNVKLPKVTFLSQKDLKYEFFLETNFNKSPFVLLNNLIDIFLTPIIFIHVIYYLFICYPIWIFFIFKYLLHLFHQV